MTPVSLIHRALLPLWISSVGVVVFASLMVGMRAQYRPSYRALLESSLDEPRIGQTLAVNRLNEAIEPVQRVPFHVAIVQAKSEFVNVAMQMFRAGVMVDAVHPALHNRPNTLNRVRVHIASAVLPGAVVHGVVTEKETTYSSVAGRFIGHKLSADFDVIQYRTLQALFIGVRDGISDGPTAALPESDNGSLAHRTATGAEFLGLMFIGLFATEKGFVSFDDTLQLFKFSTARLTEPMKHEPCRFLLNADLFGDLHRTDSLTGGDEQIHGIEPLVERDVRPLEDGSRADGEIKLALIAAVKASLAGRDAILTGASWARNTFRPKTTLKVDAGGFLVWEHLEKLERADGRTAHSCIHPFSISSDARPSALRVMTERRPPECSIGASSYAEQQIALFKSCCLAGDSKIARRGLSRFTKYRKVLGCRGSSPMARKVSRCALRSSRRRRSEGERWRFERPILFLLNRGNSIFKSRIAVECPNLDDAIPASAVSLERVLDGEGVTGNRASFVPVVFHDRGDEAEREAESGSLFDGGGGELSGLIEFHEPLHFYRLREADCLMYLRYLIPSFLSSEKMKGTVENFFDGSQVRNSPKKGWSSTNAVFAAVILLCALTVKPFCALAMAVRPLSAFPIWPVSLPASG